MASGDVARGECEPPNTRVRSLMPRSSVTNLLIATPGAVQGRDVGQAHGRRATHLLAITLCWLTGFSLDSPPVMAQRPDERPMVDVVVLSKFHPMHVKLDGECTARLGGKSTPISSASWVNGRLQLCGPRARCQEADEVVFSCKQDVTVTIPGEVSRRYGRRVLIRRDHRELRVVARLPLERYVAGVVAAELVDAPPAARAAQAVLARTYAAFAEAHPRHQDAPLCDLTHCQAFAGATTALPNAEAMTGQVMKDASGNVAEVFYHSTCGGQTIAARDAWPGSSAKGTIGVRDVDSQGAPFCVHSPHFSWSCEIDRQRLAEIVQPWLTSPVAPAQLAIHATADPGSWVIASASESTTVSSFLLHRTLGRSVGWGCVKSPSFRITALPEHIRFMGQGLGHRVGLCQYGAIARARSGQSAAQILRAYFPAYHLSRMVDR